MFDDFRNKPFSDRASLIAMFMCVVVILVLWALMFSIAPLISIAFLAAIGSPLFLAWITGKRK